MTQPHQIDREAVALLPCPFCGDAPKIESDAGETLIYCVNDQCIIFTRAPAPYNDYGHRASAIAAWNRRPAPMEAVAWREKVEQLERLLKQRDRLGKNSTTFWVRAARAAMAGDMRELRNRVDMAEAPPADAILALIATHPVQALDSSLRDTHRAAETDVLADCPGCGVAPLHLHKTDCEIMLSRTPASDTTGGCEAAGQRSEPKSTHPEPGA